MSADNPRIRPLEGGQQQPPRNVPFPTQPTNPAPNLEYYKQTFVGPDATFRVRDSGVDSLRRSLLANVCASFEGRDITPWSDALPSTDASDYEARRIWSLRDTWQRVFLTTLLDGRKVDSILQSREMPDWRAKTSVVSNVYQLPSCRRRKQLHFWTSGTECLPAQWSSHDAR